jgi:hypothetical protein
LSGGQTAGRLSGPALPVNLFFRGSRRYLLAKRNTIFNA